MITLLQSIVDTIVSLITFLLHSVESLLNLLIHIPSYVSFLSVSLSYLPALVLPFALASVSIYVVFLVLGRN